MRFDLSAKGTLLLGKVFRCVFRNSIEYATIELKFGSRAGSFLTQRRSGARMRREI